MNEVTPTPATRRQSSSAGTAKPRKRAPGRPAADSPDLREQLLDAALACFVRQGIAATSLRDIAAEAGVTPALLHYYFGDKPQLQEALIQQRLLPAFMIVRSRLAAAGDDLADTIAAFICGVTEAIKQHPWWPQLWVREVLCEGGALRESVLFQKIGPVLPQMMAKRFAQAQAEGRINPDLDPRLLMVSLIGLTLFPAASAPIWRFMFDAEYLDLDTQRRHALALLDRGLMP